MSDAAASHGIKAITADPRFRQSYFCKSETDFFAVPCALLPIQMLALVNPAIYSKVLHPDEQQGDLAKSTTTSRRNSIAAKRCDPRKT
jgi:hypothetical protein